MHSVVQIKYKNELWLNPLYPVCNNIGIRHALQYK